MAQSKLAIYPSLEGRSVFVTGGGSGIGAAIVEAFAGQKSKIAFIDIDEAASLALVSRLASEGHVAPLFIRCDIRDIAALKASIEQARAANGPITVLVNNAASDQRHAFDTVTPDYWDERMAINLRPMFFTAQAVQPQMAAEGGGAIVNFGSTSWRIGQGGMAAYTAAKSAVLGLTRSQARDFGPRNIRVNSLSPGWIMTERQLKLWVTPETDELINRSQCLKRRLQPIDIARVVLFLASDDAGAITNQDYIVDGGWV
ncbi:MAG: SDR family NAD(P)-dependent oxidoreductase [Hyphomicrobiales bacterium]